MQLWDGGDGQQLAPAFDVPHCPTTEAVLTSDGRSLIIGSTDGVMLGFDLAVRLQPALWNTAANSEADLLGMRSRLISGCELSDNTAIIRLTAEVWHATWRDGRQGKLSPAGRLVRPKSFR